MAIAPVGIVDYKASNNVHFGHRSHKNDSVHSQEPKVASKMVTIPLATLMALMPLANGASQGSASAQNRMPEQTELLAQNVTSKRSKVPYECPHFEANYRVVHNERFSSSGKMQNLVFANYASDYIKGEKDVVSQVYLIPDGYVSHVIKTPAEVRTLVYHNLGPGKEYCGVIVFDDIYEDEDKGATGDFKGTYVAEYRLSDDAANVLIDMLAGKSKMKNETSIKFVETTNPNRQYPYMYNPYTGKRW